MYLHVDYCFDSGVACDVRTNVSFPITIRYGSVVIPLLSESVSYTHLDVYKRQVLWLYPYSGNMGKTKLLCKNEMQQNVLKSVNTCVLYLLVTYIFTELQVIQSGL